VVHCFRFLLQFLSLQQALMDLMDLLVQRIPVVQSLLLSLVHQRTQLILEGPQVRVVQESQEYLYFLVLPENPVVLEFQEVQQDLEHPLALTVHLIRTVPWHQQVRFRPTDRELRMIQRVLLVQMGPVHREDQHFQSAPMVQQVRVYLKPQFLLSLLENQMDPRGQAVLGRR